MMPVRCQADAESLLGPHFPAFAEIVLDVIGDFYKTFGTHVHALELWTQRGIIRDLIKERLISYCASQRGLDYVRRGNATLFGGHNVFVWKIKKLNDHLKIARNQTQACLDFEHNRSVVQDDLIDGLDPTMLYLGWVPTENDPLNPPIYLVCNSEAGGIEWSIQLKRPAPKPPAEMSPTSPTAPEAPSRVRVKTGSKNASNA